MIKVKWMIVLSLAALLAVTASTACKRSDSNDLNTVASGNIIGSETLPADETETHPLTYMDQVIRDIPATVFYKGRSIYLEFGARGTVNIENFNRLFLAEKLGLDIEKYSVVIEPCVIAALRENEAYGGIGYGQEWGCRLPIAIKNLITEEVSDTYELSFVLQKSQEANEKRSK